MVFIPFLARVRHDGIAASGNGLAVPRHGWVVFLHYADSGGSVKEMYRFRQIRRLVLYMTGESTLSSPLLH
jgi:hypothetical protein